MSEEKLNNIFKSYDIRGEYPEKINQSTAEKIGNALAVFLEKNNQSKQVIIGRDMRQSGEEIFQGLSKALTQAGFDVWDLGLVSTDTVYFASGKYDSPAVMITASHNPKEYNGMKMMLAGARGIGSASGLDEIKKYIIEGKKIDSSQTGMIIKKEAVLDEYIKKTKSFVQAADLKPIKVVIDTGNGMAGKILPLLFNGLPIDYKPLYFELDGSFPNHEANPIKEETLDDLKISLQQDDYDFGMAFDGDGDRVFFIDKEGNTIDSSFIICLVAEALLLKKPGSRILYNAICSQAVPEVIKDLGGEPVMGKVGHTFIKQTMREQDILFGGEKSGHFYYRDNYFADSAFITMLLVWEILSKKNMALSKAIKDYQKYYTLPEHNFLVKDKQLVMQELKNKYSNGEISEFEGLTIKFNDWWFNVRPSGTEPYLRLNMEADNKQIAEDKLKEITEFINQYK